MFCHDDGYDCDDDDDDDDDDDNAFTCWASESSCHVCNRWDSVPSRTNWKTIVTIITNWITTVGMTNKRLVTMIVLMEMMTTMMLISDHPGHCKGQCDNFASGSREQGTGHKAANR